MKNVYMTTECYDKGILTDKWYYHYIVDGDKFKHAKNNVWHDLDTSVSYIANDIEVLKISEDRILRKITKEEYEWSQIK